VERELIIAAVLLISMFAIGLPIFYYMRKHRRRENLLAMPFPETWEQILQQNVALYRILPPEKQRELHGLIMVFLHEKEFEGCAGFQITEEVKLTVAAPACMLLLNKPTEYYPTMHSVLLYPGAFLVNGRTRANSGVYDEAMDVHLGESWQHGAVALAWDQVIHDCRRPRSRQNVVIHEFAHQIDQAHGFSDSHPVFSTTAEAERFARVVRREFERRRIEVDDGIDDVIDEYGVVNQSEFFAVATEAFFTMPVELRCLHRELYECLTTFYRLDPADWR